MPNIEIETTQYPSLIAINRQNIAKTLQKIQKKLQTKLLQPFQWLITIQSPKQHQLFSLKSPN